MWLFKLSNLSNSPHWHNKINQTYYLILFNAFILLFFVLFSNAFHLVLQILLFLAFYKQGNIFFGTNVTHVTADKPTVLIKCSLYGCPGCWGSSALITWIPAPFLLGTVLSPLPLLFTFAVRPRLPPVTSTGSLCITSAQAQQLCVAHGDLFPPMATSQGKELYSICRSKNEIDVKQKSLRPGNKLKTWSQNKTLMILLIKLWVLLSTALTGAGTARSQAPQSPC